MMRRGILIGSAVALVLVGCGGDGNSATETEAMPREQVIAEGDAICTEFREKKERFEAVYDEAAANSEYVRAADATDQIVAALEEAHGGLSGLQSAEDQAVLDRANDAREGVIADLRAFSDFIREGDYQGAQTQTEEMESRNEGEDQELRDFGFEVCGAED